MEQGRPKISIITITYNAEKYLERTLISVQKALDKVNDSGFLEYIIIDGASSDGTKAIIEQYSFLLNKVVSEPDKGLYDAMNKGLNQAQGEYLWFLNAGDEVRDENVFLQLKEAFHSKNDIYYSDAMLVKEDGSEVGLRSVLTPHTLPENIKWTDLALGMKICHQAFIPRKAICGAYDTENLSADIDWEIRCLKKASGVQKLNFVLCNYLMGGLSVKQHRRSLKDRYIVLSRHFGYIPAFINHIRIFWRSYWFIRKNGRYW
jgi:glycosyltransferase involved in cell wall biosynthesis